MIDVEARKAGAVVLAGGIILYPTDTIWGIGCDATNVEAVQRIYEIKQRSDSKSMLVLMAQTSMLNQYLESVPEQALEIIRSASKPTTIIYPDARNLAANLVAADGTIGIRIAKDEFCRQLIGLTGVPIVSTSANRSGKPAPGSFRAIDPTILQKVDHVVRWRQNETGSPAPSAIIRLDDHGRSTIIRP
ncbi:MAG: L-threonylcarbamoyladenylate synthase [Bacteroidota bacterium]